MGTKTYDPSNVSLIVGGRIVKEWNTVTVERDEDIFTLTAGTQGEATRTRNLNTLGKMTITIPQTSNDNDQMSAIANTRNLISCGLIDKNGLTVLTMPEGSITKYPSVEMGKESGEREWIVAGQIVDPFLVAGAL